MNILHTTIELDDENTLMIVKWGESYCYHNDVYGQKVFINQEKMLGKLQQEWLLFPVHKLKLLEDFVRLWNAS